VISGVLIVFGLVILVVVLVVIWGVATYNALVRLRNLVQESWRQIEGELNRRHDLIPNLVETVRGYAAHEQAVFAAVTRARAAASTPGASPAAQGREEGALTQALGRLFAVAEAYPQLRANQGFLQLQGELTNTEDRIAAGRRFYNANVRNLNTKIESFPSSIIAGMGHFARAEYFEPTAPGYQQVPQVTFTQAPPAPPQPGGLYPGPTPQG
jgi:LemA protein